MKKIVTITFLLISTAALTIAQDKFVYNETGLNPKFLVVNIEGKTQKELFEKTVNWIKETYKNPDEVIKTTIDTSKIRFEGSIDNYLCVTSLGLKTCYPAFYTIEIEFKEGRYKFSVLNLEILSSASQYSSGGRVRISMDKAAFETGLTFYNNSGQLKKMYENYPASIESLFNGLNEDLMKYIKDTGEGQKKDNW